MGRQVKLRKSLILQRNSFALLPASMNPSRELSCKSMLRYAVIQPNHLASSQSLNRNRDLITSQMKISFAAIALSSSFLFGTFTARADFPDNTPVTFKRETFVWGGLIPGNVPPVRVSSGESAMVRDSFTFRRDPQSPFDPTNNPLVTWVDIDLEQDPVVSTKVPLDDGTNNGEPLGIATPTGSFPAPTMQPEPTIIFPSDHVRVTIFPVLSHHINFTYDTLIRRTGTNDEWQSIGGLQAPSYIKGKSYLREIAVPASLTSGISTNLSLDLKTVISYGDAEIFHLEHTGGIIVRPKPAFQLTNAHIDGNNFVAALNGIDAGQTYQVEWSVDMTAWLPAYSFSPTSEGQPVSIPIDGGGTKYLRVTEQ
jgi:hypothetical protein